MNILLWILQAVLALLCLAGGAYKVFQTDQIYPNQLKALTHGGWRTLGVLELVCGILVIVPAAVGWKPVLTLVAVAVIALESLALSAFYARYSLRMVAANPLVWTLATALIAVVVSFGRYALSPLA